MERQICIVLFMCYATFPVCMNVIQCYSYQIHIMICHDTLWGTNVSFINIQLIYIFSFNRSILQITFNIHVWHICADTSHKELELVQKFLASSSAPNRNLVSLSISLSEAFGFCTFVLLIVQTTVLESFWNVVSVCLRRQAFWSGKLVNLRRQSFLWWYDAIIFFMRPSTKCPAAIVLCLHIVMGISRSSRLHSVQ